MRSFTRLIAHAALLWAIIFLTGLKGRAQTYVFGTASYPSSGGSNTPLVTADFNRDGIPDLAVMGSNTAGPLLEIRMGKADGTLAPSVDYTVPGNGLVVGDFNGDHIPDLIVIPSATTYPPAISVMLGNGDGSFQAPVAAIAGNYASAAVGDFNGDGKMDLAVIVGSSSSSTLAIALGNGDGTFQPLANYAITISPYLVVGDFNGDGKSDVVVSGPSYSSNNLLQVFLGSSTGALQGPANYTTSGFVESVVAADLNNDGKLDLAVAFGGTTPGVEVLPGIGDGTFASSLVYNSNLLSTYSTSMAVVDFDGDGNIDLALTNSTGNEEGIYMLLGKGDGTFQDPPLFYGAGLQPVGLVALDLNGDGKPDLAAAGGYSTYTTLTVMLNRGDGTFPIGAPHAVGGWPSITLAGDFDGDGKMDVATPATVYNSTGLPIGGVASVLLGKGDGSFKPSVETNISNSIDAAVAGDFNHDGKLDIAVSESMSTGDELNVLIGNGDGTFHEAIGQATPSISASLAAGDFNGDGNLDIASVAFNDTNLTLFIGHGDGTFAAPVQFPIGPMTQSPPIHSVLAGDFNGDGRLDVAVATDNGIAILLGNGDGTFQPMTLVPPILTYEAGESIFALADFNHDGKLDILRTTGSGDIGVALGNGDGTFQAAASFSPPSILNIGAAVVGDFNADGKLDVAFAGQSPVMMILFGNGDGTFGSSITYASDWMGSLNFMAAADFNGDSVPDIALANSSAGDVSVYLSSPVAAFYPRGLSFASQALGTASPDQSVSLSNSGTAPLNIPSVAGSGDFIASNQCDTTLGIGESCQVNVSFAPTAAGMRTGMLTFTDNASVIPQSLALSGSGTGAGAGLSTTSLSFGVQYLNVATAAQTVTLENAGDTTLMISGISTPADFPETNTCGTSLATGNSCTISVSFKPTTTGLITGSLTITDNAADSPQRVDLSGTGNDSKASLSASSLTFASQLLNTNSAAQTITLSSTGTTPLTISGISTSGDFAQTNNCGASVAAGTNCMIQVTLSPTAAGTRTGTLTITDNAADSPQTVSLTGDGEDFTVTAGSGSTTSASVARGQAATYNLAVGPTWGLSGTITFNCTNLPAESACSFSPTSVSSNGTSASNVTVRISTTAQGEAPGPGLMRVPKSPIPFAWFVLAGLLASVLVSLRLRPRGARLQRWAAMALLVAMLAGAGLASCGGGGGSSINTNPGTPPGNYIVNFNATITSGSTTVTGSIPLTLTVQ